MSHEAQSLNGQQHGSQGTKSQSHRTSVFAEALRYEAVQGSPSTGDVEKTSTPKSTSDASPTAPYLEPVQASVFSAFGKEGESEGFEGAGRPVHNNYPDKSPVNDMTKQCSMIHRMMEKDKTDIDPRDVHKLLPSTMLSSESLDLRPDGVLGRISQGAAGMDLHSLLEEQASKFVAENEHGCASKEEQQHQQDATRVVHTGGETTICTAQDASTSSLDNSSSSPTSPKTEKQILNTKQAGTSPAAEQTLTTKTTGLVEESTQKQQQQQQQIASTKAVPASTSTSSHHQSPPTGSRSAENGQVMTTANLAAPDSPVTGWPAEPVLGIMHPMNHTICHVSRAAEVVSQASPPPHPLIYTETTAQPPPSSVSMGGLCRGGNNTNVMGNGKMVATPVLVDWSGAAYPPHQLYPEAQTDQHHHRVLNYHSVVIVSPSGSETQNSSPRQKETSPNESNGSDSGNSAKDRMEDANSKNFKSLEAALAWCHVQHSQKQVPVVPKDDVRKLVDFQLTSGKPIRAPWYRPQTNDPVEQAEKKVPEKKPKIPRPEKPRRSSSNGKKQGTGFFCPPGSSMTRV